MEENKKELDLEELKNVNAGHDGQGEYKCPECDYSTNDYYSLELHLMTHYDRSYRPRR